MAYVSPATGMHISAKELRLWAPSPGQQPFYGHQQCVPSEGVLQGWALKGSLLFTE